MRHAIVGDFLIQVMLVEMLEIGNFENLGDSSCCCPPSVFQH